jgi:polar amino acid transport system permease protein
MGGTFIEQLPAFFSAGNMILLAEALGATVALTFFGCALGFTFAFLIVVARQTPGRWAMPLRGAAILFVELFRRVPFLVTSYLVLFSISAVTRNPSLFVIVLVAIAIYAVAFTADIIRGGFESIPRQQIEAAQTLNFGRWRTMFHVIIPQSWPVILPPLIIFTVAFVKDTSLVGYLGVFELAFRAKELNNQGFSGPLVYGFIALLYFCLSYPLMRFGYWLEKRLATSRGQKSQRELR